MGNESSLLLGYVYSDFPLEKLSQWKIIQIKENYMYPIVN